MAIYQKTNDAQTIINASPLRFELGHAEASAPVSRLQHWDPPLTAENQGQIDGGGSIEREDTIDGQEEPHEVDHVQQRPDEATSKSSTALGGKAKWGALRTSLIQHQATATVTATATAPAPAPAPATASPSSEAQLQNFTPNPPPVTGSAKDISQTLPPSEPSREFHLIIERSVLNHHAYIQRQHYYAGFQLDLKNTMADDLRARVPVPGMADCQLMKGDAPLRLRNKKKQDEEAQPWKSLGQLWREGLRSEDGNGINDKVRESADYFREYHAHCGYRSEAPLCVRHARSLAT